MSFFTPFAFRSGVINGYDPDAQAFIDVTGITGTDADAINNLVLDLKADNLWTKMKIIYPMVGGTADTCKYNLIDPQNTDAAYRITWTGSNTFNANGVTFGGTTADYGNTNLILSGSSFSLNSGHISYYNRTQNPFVTTVACFCGIRQVSNSSQITITNTSGSFSSYAGPSLFNEGNVSTVVGQMLTSRTTSTLEKMYINGTPELTDTSTSTNLSNVVFLLGCRNFPTSPATLTPQNPVTSNCAFFSAGDGLDDTEVSNFYTIVQDYQTALGRQV